MDLPRRPDPLAVALGNASLLGVGYLLLRRRRLAVATVAVTVALVAVTVAVAAVWCEVLVLVWWGGTIAHGWFAAGPRAASARHRLVALAVTVPVLLVIGLLRFDTARIEGRVTAARDAGDCPGVVAAQDRLWFGHRVAGASLAARGDATVRTCRRLAAAKAELVTALDGHTKALGPGYAALAAALREPGNDKIVAAALDGFLDGLPAEDPCVTVAVTDRLRARKPSHDVLDRTAAAVRRTAPKALVGCGDALMKIASYEQARARYQQLLDQYPDDAHAAGAKDGAELAHVSELLSSPPPTPRLAYCAHPAKYSKAEPYGRGTNRAVFIGGSDEDYTDKLPGSWRTTDPADARAVVCVDEKRQGAAAQTCPYRDGDSGGTTEVTFHKIAVPVEVYELRTGKRVARRTLQIGGSSCPPFISYTRYGTFDPGPDRDQDVTPSDSDIRDAFRPLVIR